MRSSGQLRRLVVAFEPRRLFELKGRREGVERGRRFALGLRAVRWVARVRVSLDHLSSENAPVAAPQ